MTKFRDRTSGAIIEFSTQFDIDSMKGHPNYDRLDEAGEVVQPEPEERALPFNSPQRGRPKKAK
mgnify:CR=1 FL=1